MYNVKHELCANIVHITVTKLDRQNFISLIIINLYQTQKFLKYAK